MAVKEIPDDDGNLVEFYSCPMLWVNHGKSVREFIDMRAYLDKYPHTAKGFHDRNPRYVAFDQYFTAKLSEYGELMKREG